MFAAALIVFRESLEAALVIGIVAAATRPIARRGWWIALGAAAGVVGAFGVAAVAQSISQLAGGAGQELFTAVVLAMAVAMLAWHNIWMASHGRQIAMQAREFGRSIVRGETALTAIITAIALTVLREGSETVLFLIGISSSAASSRASLAIGSVLGLAAGGGAGVLMYAGLLRVPVSRLFHVTGWLILLLAAGMAGQFARVLIQADVLPALASPLWDTSSWMPDDSVLGTLLRALLGYQAQPSATQVLFYVAALVLIFAAMRRAQSRIPAA
ncbi:MAG TPA: FTR1 family protein [Burkholderiaceae bacterium]|jgi:high-affinity iron transporter|nr:FTR1 family protein [Burkholderiaceae bacterium]